MAESITVYLHFPCFDGVISAVLASEYLFRARGWNTGRIVPVNYDEQKRWPTRRLSQPAVVVDFLYHPKAQFWADHHQTSFCSESLKADYLRRRSPDLLYDPSASSCAELLWRKTFKQLSEPRFREMVDWARRIDAARYHTVQEAVLGNAPALKISLSFMNDPSAEYCRFLVESLRVRTLNEVAASNKVRDRYAIVRRAIKRGQRLFSSASRLDDNGIVVFQLPRETDGALFSRYAPYLAHPNARYSLGILPHGDGAKITAMRNPWLRFKSVPLGQIFRNYGGGGHERVASVLLNNRAEAETTLGAILKDIESRTGSSAKKVKRSLSR